MIIDEVADELQAQADAGVCVHEYRLTHERWARFLQEQDWSFDADVVRVYGPLGKVRVTTWPGFIPPPF